MECNKSKYLQCWVHYLLINLGQNKIRKKTPPPLPFKSMMNSRSNQKALFFFIIEMHGGGRPKFFIWVVQDLGQNKMRNKTPLPQISNKFALKTKRTFHSIIETRGGVLLIFYLIVQGCRRNANDTFNPVGKSELDLRSDFPCNW